MAHALDSIRILDTDGCAIGEVDGDGAEGFTAYVRDGDAYTDTVYVTVKDGVLTVGLYGFGGDADLRVYHVDRNRVRTDLLV